MPSTRMTGRRAQNALLENKRRMDSCRKICSEKTAKRFMPSSITGSADRGLIDVLEDAGLAVADIRRQGPMDRREGGRTEPL
jgi:hypothetical protein